MLPVKQGEGSEWVSTPISLLLFLSLPSINPSSLLLLLLLLLSSPPPALHLPFFMLLPCVSHGRSTEDFTWQANYDLQLVLISRHVTSSVNKTKQSITRLQRRFLKCAPLMSRFSKDLSCWIIVQAELDNYNSILFYSILFCSVLFIAF